ncbi:MRG-domain-containing protein [Gaertneriomyces semiglobifer]|nr:MRG-domain-containing protein [Gaertneriomyces semiglobifer]
MKVVKAQTTAVEDPPPRADEVDPPYKEGETILCYHGPLLYEAKVLKANAFSTDELEATTDPKALSDITIPGQYYYIHYKGWNTKWDSWVPQSRTLKLTKENLKKQLELKKSVGARRLSNSYNLGKADEQDEPMEVEDKTAEPGPKKRGRRPKKEEDKEIEKEGDKASSTPPASDRKRRRDSMAMSRLALSSNSTSTPTPPPYSPEVPCPPVQLTDKLNKHLQADREKILLTSTDISLPVTPSVSEILGQYLEHCIEEGPQEITAGEDKPWGEGEVACFLEGIMGYFDTAIGNQLLYAEERGAWDRAMEPAASSGDSSSQPASPKRTKRPSRAETAQTRQPSMDTDPTAKPRGRDLAGTAHLLRLLTRIHIYFERSGVDEETMKSLLQNCDRLVTWLDSSVSI